MLELCGVGVAMGNAINEVSFEFEGEIADVYKVKL